MNLPGFVFDVGSSDSDTTSLLFRSLVDHVVVHNLTVSRCLSKDLGDGSGKGGLSVTIRNRIQNLAS